MTDSGSVSEEENLFLASANSGQLVSVGDKKSQVLSKLMKLEGDLVSDLYSAKTLRAIPYGGGKKVAIRFLQ